MASSRIKGCIYYTTGISVLQAKAKLKTIPVLTTMLSDYAYGAHYRAATDLGRRIRESCMNQLSHDTDVRVVLTPEGKLQFTDRCCDHHRYLDDGVARVCVELLYIVPGTNRPIVIDFSSRFAFDPTGSCIVETLNTSNCLMSPECPLEWLTACRMAPGAFERVPKFVVRSPFYAGHECMICGEFTGKNECLCHRQCCLIVVMNFCAASYLLWCLTEGGYLCEDVLQVVRKYAALICVDAMMDVN